MTTGEIPYYCDACGTRLCVCEEWYYCQQCERLFCEDCWNARLHEDQESDEDYELCGECWEEMKGEPNESTN